MGEREVDPLTRLSFSLSLSVIYVQHMYVYKCLVFFVSVPPVNISLSAISRHYSVHERERGGERGEKESERGEQGRFVHLNIATAFN